MNNFYVNKITPTGGNHSKTKLLFRGEMSDTAVDAVLKLETSLPSSYELFIECGETQHLINIQLPSDVRKIVVLDKS